MPAKSRISIRFRVAEDFVHPSTRNIWTTPLFISPAEINFGIASLQSPGFGPANFTVDYYLRTVLLALDYGLGRGRSFRLMIERENIDLRRVVSEAFGVGSGALLLNRDLEADWRSFVQIDSRHLRKPTRRWRRRRPDLLCEASPGTVLLECKGTTAFGSVKSMLETAYNQVKYARLASGRINGRYLTCMFLPLADDSRAPTIWAGDPDEPSGEGASFIIDERALQKSLWLHYARVANMAGLELLASLLWEHAGEEDAPRVDPRSVAEEMERAEAQATEIAGRRFITRWIETPILSERVPPGLRCPRYRIEIRIDADVAGLLLQADVEGLRARTQNVREVREDLRALFRDGSGIVMTAAADGEALDPTVW